MKRKGPPDPRRAKIHLSYTVAEAAQLFDVHRNTIRHWIKGGLGTVKAGGLVLILGDELRAFLTRQRSKRRVKCPLGHMFCLKCRVARRPPKELIEIVQHSRTTANLRGLCPVCESLMHRRANLSRLNEIGFGQLSRTAAGLHLTDSPAPSLNCHNG